MADSLIESTEISTPILLLEWWRPVLDFEGIYQVSNMARVERVAPGLRTYAGRIITSTKSTSTDRFGITLAKNGIPTRFDTHVIVARAFLGKASEGFEVDHVDGDHLNNRLSNLEYVTPEENKARAMRLGLLAKGEANGNALLTEATVIEIRSSPLSQHAMARKLGVSRSAICDARAYRTWKHLP